MDFYKLRARFRQFGGMKLVKEYLHLGVLPAVVESFFRCIVKKQSFKKIYPAALKKVEPFLVKKYSSLMKERKAYYLSTSLHNEHGRHIWFCWLQGVDSAPSIVKACRSSLATNLSDRTIVDIDAKNWKEYVDLPDHIISKWESGCIPPAQFSDLLRLQLLIKYGGTWIDSTVLCTGRDGTEEFLDADLFLFQYTKPGSDVFGGISNWFISACTNNSVLMVLRDMLFEYWKDYDCVLDYYMFHLFFSMLVKEDPGIVTSMPYGYSRYSLVLLHHWKEPFDPEFWNKAVSFTSFHKLSFRVSEKTVSDKSNYYNHILSSFLG